MTDLKYKTRFIAGASCPECGDTDTLKLHVPCESGEEYVECVSCGMQKTRPKAESESKDQTEVIGLFKQ